MSRRRRKQKKYERQNTTWQPKCQAPVTSVPPTMAQNPSALDDNHEFNFKSAERIHYLENLMAKQLELYTWCEEKVTTLATIDTILLGGATFFVGRIGSDTFQVRTVNNCWDQVLSFVENHFTIIIVFLMFVPIFLSLGLTLWHVIPKMRSGTTASSIINHRSTVGIRRHKDNAEYKKRLDSISVDEIYFDLVRQIYGMNTNIWKNQISIKTAVILDLIGLSGFLSIMLYVVFTGNGSVIF